jgi:predicted dehydrogenase
MSALRVAILGCGPRGVEHAEALARVSGLELAAVVDSAEDRRRALAERYAARAYESAEHLIAGADTEIAIVATPPGSRADLVGEVLAMAGLRAVIAEKPLSLDLADAERQVEACRRRDVVLAVSHQSRYASGFRRVKELIQAGALGRVDLLAGVCYGPLLDQGNHLVDTLRWFADSEVSWVMSAAEDQLDKLAPYLPTDMIPWSGDAHPSPRWMTHHLAFENGVRATMETGLLYRRSKPFIDDWLQRRVTAVGTGGAAECRASGFLRVTGASTILEEPDRIERVADATVALHEDVRDAVLERRAVRASGEDALETLRVVLACEKGAADGGLVAVR